MPVKKAAKVSKKPKVTKHVKPAKATKAAKPVAKKVAVAVKKPFSKSEVLNHIAESTGLKRKEVANVMDSLVHLISLHVDKKGPGEFNLHGILKIRKLTKPATKARKGINPFTKEPMTFKAKPARNVIKVRPLSKLKEAAAA